VSGTVIIDTVVVEDPLPTFNAFELHESFNKMFYERGNNSTRTSPTDRPSEVYHTSLTDISFRNIVVANLSTHD
jgi:hypothetical protein